jgi:hypothetical protein
MNYALRGDSERALDLLEQAYENQEMEFITLIIHPCFKTSGNIPGFSLY